MWCFDTKSDKIETAAETQRKGTAVGMKRWLSLLLFEQVVIAEIVIRAIGEFGVIGELVDFDIDQLVLRVVELGFQVDLSQLVVDVIEIEHAFGERSIERVGLDAARQTAAVQFKETTASSPTASDR